MKRARPGAAPPVSRMRQPAFGNVARLWKRRLEVLDPRDDSSLLGNRNARVIADQAARLHETGLGQCVYRNHQPRSEVEHAGDAIGFALNDRTHLDRRFADPQPVADSGAQPRQQGCLGNCAPGAAPPGEGFVQRDVGNQFYISDERIGVVDGLELDHRTSVATLFGPGHRAHFRRARYRQRPFGDVRVLFDCRGSVQEAEVNVAAEKRTAVRAQACDDRLADSADGGDGRNAQGEAGDEDAEPPDPAPQLAPCQLPGQGEAVHPLPPPATALFAAAASSRRSSPVIRPSPRLTMRRQRSARYRSWVISTSVVPRRR